MNAFEKFIYAFTKTVETPQILGWYHFLCIAIVIIASALVIIFRKKISEKGVKYTLLALSIFLILLETMKQLTFSFSYDEATQVVSWDYQWYAFPFQFCSTPMYIMLIASLVKKGRFRDMLYSYLGTFALFAGTVVMIYPGDVFYHTIFINFQTMFWHGSMVVLGVLLWATNSIEFKHKTILKALGIFVVVLTIAMFMNFIWKWAGGVETGETFNMFFISPYYPCSLPLLEIIFANTPYIIFLLVYILGFTLSAYIFLLIPMFINHTAKRIRLKKDIKLFNANLQELNNN